MSGRTPVAVGPSTSGVDGGDDFLGGVVQGPGRRIGETGLVQQLGAGFGVGAFQAHHHRHGDVDFLTAAMMASAIMSQRTIPPKMLDQHALHRRVSQDQFESSTTRSFGLRRRPRRKLAGWPP